MNLRKLLPIAIFTLSAFTGNSQIMGTREPFADVAIKAGGSFQTLSGAPVKAAPGWVAGISVRKPLYKFGARAELLAIHTRYKTKFPASLYSLYTPGMDTVSKGDFEVLYGALPLLIDYRLNNSLKVLAGAQLSYILNIKDKNGVYTSLYGDDAFIKISDFSLVAGLELNVAKNVDVAFRLVKGATDVNNSKYYLVPKAWTTTGLQVTASYKIL
ncbi:MAG: outer membrane beta-barrel protein [Taibaiella sp.]|nr:outer membrane beta-barrel protein [Taibaiella sp.]